MSIRSEKSWTGIRTVYRRTVKSISSRKRSRAKADGSNGAGLESILRETPKLILARRISKALSQVSKGSPLTLAQAKDVLVFALTYLETHPDADLQQGLPEVAPESF